MTKDGEVNISNEIILEIANRIKSRFPKGVKQADLLFFDLTGTILFSTLDVPIDDFHRMIKPKQYRIIFYTTSFYPHGTELYHTYGEKEKYLGKIEFPNLLSFKGYYLDFDPYLWNFLSNEQHF